jgi:hypothetical protein
MKDLLSPGSAIGADRLEEEKSKIIFYKISCDIYLLKK